MTNFEDLLKDMDATFGDAVTIPGADALIPFNPVRLPGHIIGNALAQEGGTFLDRIKGPAEDIAVASDYIGSSCSPEQWQNRTTEVLKDTMIINGLAEAGGALGPVAGGAWAHQSTERYLRNKADFELNGPVEQKFQREVVNRANEKAGLHGPAADGIGLLQQNIPAAQRNFNICPKDAGLGKTILNRWQTNAPSGINLNGGTPPKPPGFIDVTLIVSRVPRFVGYAKLIFGDNAVRCCLFVIHTYIYYLYSKYVIRICYQAVSYIYYKIVIWRANRRRLQG